MRNVHHFVAHAEEVLAHERLCKEISHVLGGGHEGDAQPTMFNTLADEVMTAVNVLRACVMFRVVG